MANEQNLVYDKGFDTLSAEELSKIASKGGKASGKARREKASFKKSLETLLNSNIRITQGAIYDKFKAMGIDISNKSLTELANLGVMLGAIEGNATNYKTLMESNNEIAVDGAITSPTVKIELVDNSKLEKTLYEENKHNENDDRQ